MDGSGMRGRAMRGRGMRGRGMRGPGMKGARMAKRLGLDDKQQAEMKNIRGAKFATVTPLKLQLVGKRVEMKELWKAERPNRAAILAKQGEIIALRAQIQEANVDFRLALMQVLTPEQRAKFVASRGFGQGKMGKGKRGKRGRAFRNGRRGKRGMRGNRGGRGGRGGRGFGGGNGGGGGPQADF